MIPVCLNDRLWNKILRIIDSWRGTPYRHMTMVKKRGADCTLFLAAIFSEAGLLTRIDKPDYYSKDWNVHTREEMVKNGLVRHLDNHMADGLFSIVFDKGDIIQDQFIRGDLLGFKTPKSKCTNHTAMWLGRDSWMINSIQSLGVSEIEYNRAWNRCLTTVYRIMVKG